MTSQNSEITPRFKAHFEIFTLKKNINISNVWNNMKSIAGLRLTILQWHVFHPNSRYFVATRYIQTHVLPRLVAYMCYMIWNPQFLHNSSLISTFLLVLFSKSSICHQTQETSLQTTNVNSLLAKRWRNSLLILSCVWTRAMKSHFWDMV